MKNTLRQIKHRIFLSPKKGFSLVVALLILLILPVTLIAVRQPQEVRQRAATSENSGSFTQIVDAKSQGFAYAYAPSIIKKDGVYHAYFCSRGGPGAWDFVRHVSSNDGINWSIPTIALKAGFNGKSNVAACDPSIVFYQGYYYLYYSSAYLLSGTVDTGIWNTNIQVARSLSLTGPFLTYTERGSWEDNPSDAKVIIKPLKEKSDNTLYGAGQQTVITKDNTLYMWYYDDTEESYENGKGLMGHIYLLESVNPVIWQTSGVKKTNYVDGSNDIKYDAHTNTFVMASLKTQHQKDSFLTINTSSDGIIWNLIKVYPKEFFADFASNVGISGGEEGQLLPEDAIVSFGAPYNLAPIDDWGHWNLYGLSISQNDLSPTYSPVGSFDAVTCNGMVGWTCDASDYSVANSIHYYVDGPYGQGTGVVGGIANTPREVQVGDRCGGNSNHGFDFKTPEYLKDGKEHTIYAYGINIGTGTNNTLLGSKSFTCAAPDVANTPVPTAPPTATPVPPISTPRTEVANPKGALDVVSCNGEGVIQGWTCDPSDYNVSLQVHYYIDGAFGVGRGVVGGNASVLREVEVGAVCGNNRSHGYSFPLPSDLRDGKEHTIYAYGINIGTGTNNTLLGSKSFSCPSSPSIGKDTVVIYAAGSAAAGVYPSMELRINGVIAQRWQNVNYNPQTKPYKPHVYVANRKLSPSEIQVAFTNDAVINGQDRNLFIDKIFINGTAIETESSQIYSTGTWSEGVGCSAGNKQAEVLHCNGYFQY